MGSISGLWGQVRCRAIQTMLVILSCQHRQVVTEACHVLHAYVHARVMGTVPCRRKQSLWAGVHAEGLSAWLWVQEI